MKKACIYVRVSTEHQADKASPQAQETEGRSLCENRGYQVVEVYRDIERYRAGGRLVEPSGTRADRPGLRRMLEDARSSLFEVIIAWREDRLYRSYRPMLDVLETIDETGIEIELVKETFDKRIAPVKAWAARMELDAKHDRYMMGIGNRFSQGKAGNHPAPYGYCRDEKGYYQVDPEEARWVLALFEGYAAGESIRKIRQNFIVGGAKQRKEDLKYPWHLAILRRILADELYWTGKQVTRWGERIYEIPAPPIVPPELAEAVQERKARYRYYPAGNTREHYLAAGLVYCSVCGVRCNIVNSHNGYMKDGTPKKYIFYQCSNAPNIDVKYLTHFSRGSARFIDNRVWEKVWKLISEPGLLEQAIEQRITELQAKQVDAQEESEKLERQLEEILLERQKVITWARKKIITESDLETQMMALSAQETGIQNELNGFRFLIGNQAEKLLKLAQMYREEVKSGYEAVAVDRILTTPEEKEAQFKARKTIVQALVERVDIHPDKTVTVFVDFPLPESVSQIPGIVSLVNIKPAVGLATLNTSGVRP